MIDPQFQLTEPQGFINNAGRFRSELAYFGSTRAHRESHSSNGTISINPTTSVDKSVDSKDDEYYAPDFVPKSTGLQPDSVTELQAQYSIKLSVGSDFNTSSTSHSTAAEFAEDYFLFDSYPPALSGWNNPSIKSASSAVHLENPERETRWYFKYFLGKYHQLYCGYVTERDPFLLAIAKSHVQSYGISQYRAILWRKTGSQKLCISYNPTTSLTAKKVLNFFDIHRIEKGPKEANNAEVQKDALTLEEQEGSVNFKFGVLYCKEGQTSDEQMYNNERGSEEFDRFVKLLGDQICLKSWDRFKGGLDTKSDTTGSYSVYTVYEGHEIMFHVSTMLPFSSEHRQQIERKRHVGNDIVNIIFVDGVEPDRQPSWMPSMMKTHFTHIFAIVTYHKETVTYKLNVFAEESVPIFGPPLPNPAEFTDPNEFREFLLVKLINGEKAAFHSPVFAQKRERTLEMLLNVICSSNLNEAGAGTLSRRTFGDAVIDSFNGITTTKEQNRVDEYIRYGQNLKLNTIIRGDAPTSSVTIGRSKINPWQPTRFNTSFHVEVVCGDSWGDHLIVSGEAGSFLLKDKGSPTPLIDRSIEVRQLEVVNQQDIMVIRYDKGKDSRLAVVYLTNLDLSSPMDRSQVKKLSLERSRGCQLFALSKSIVQPLKLAIVLHKRIVIYQWQMITGHSLSSWNQITQMDSPNSFEFLRELPILDPIQTMTFVEGIPGGRLCVGHRNQFDLIDERNREIAQIFRTESSRNQVISAHEVWSEDEPELILCFTRTCHFQKISSLQLQCCSTRKMHLPSSLSSDSNPPVSSTSNPRSPLFEQGSSSAPACSIGPCTAPSSPPNSQLSPEAHGPSIQPWSLANSIDRHKGTEFDFTWNVEPEQIVISCPYIFVFTSTSIELRLINNGSLVHTMLVPNCKLLSSKCGIFFTSTSENLDNTCSPSGLRLVSRQSGGDLGPVREGTQGTDNESGKCLALLGDWRQFC
ncbi:unnamed protein product [Dicrocoelium dendriticum]|nr:unnamed protein product [Dicrocoelium dendriticum]